MFKIGLILCFQCVIYWSQLDVSTANPLVGNNIRRAKDSEFPFVVSIGHKSVKGKPGHYHFCTGALVSKKHVLTAEHCFEGIKLQDIQVSVGSVDTQAGKKYDVDLVMTFDTWADRRDKEIKFKDNDVAVLRLKNPVDDPKIKPATLSTNSKVRELYDKDAVTAGWGVSNTGEIPRYMETAKLHVITYNDCMEHVKKIAGKTIIIPNNYVCTESKPYTLIQYGDSGGPLFIGNVIIGINGATFPEDKPDDDPNVQNLHVPIYYYKEFIDDVVNNY